MSNGPGSIIEFGKFENEEFDYVFLGDSRIETGIAKPENGKSLNLGCSGVGANIINENLKSY